MTNYQQIKKIILDHQIHLTLCNKSTTMRSSIVLLSGFIITLNLWSQQVQHLDYKTYFNDNTMRVDYFHSGTATEEHFAVGRILNDASWSGSKTMLLDNLKLGLYFFEVLDQVSSKILYSRGFASIFGEWQTIAEAKKQWGTFHESVRFPWPLNPVILVLYKRNNLNEFDKIWETSIDPASRSTNPAVNSNDYKVYTILDNGVVNNKVDIVLLGDGYKREEMEKFREDAKRLSQALLAVEPFKSRKNDISIRAVETPSKVSGVNRPHPGIFKRTPLSVSYSSFDSERYALAYDNRTIRDAAASVPYDFMIILINEETYGGGGIYQLYATVAADNKFSDYIFVHEFGHHFAALADEYYTSSVSYEMGEISVEPWESNITALLDTETLKWKYLVEKETPLPTSWEKEKYDNFSYNIQKERKELRSKKVPESEVETLFERERKESIEILDHMEYSGKVGAFEGGGYMQFGIYRPYADCIMFTRNKQVFCPVCQEAISTVIDQYTK